MNLGNFGARLLEEVPADFACEWDNVGWSVGPLSQQLTGVMVSVDPSPEAVDVALEKNCNLLFCHHPLLFEPVKQLVESNPPQNLVLKAARESLGIFALHTNADACPGGLNDIYADYLDLQERQPVQLVAEEEPAAGLGRVGDLAETVTVRQLEKKLSTRSEISYFRRVGDPEAKVTRLALCTGSGGELIERPSVVESDLFITADLKHHDVEAARARGLNLIILDHYEMEQVFLDFARELLKKKLKVSEAIHYFERKNPYRHTVQHKFLTNREEK